MTGTDEIAARLSKARADRTAIGSHRGWMWSATISGEPRSSASQAARKPRSGSLTPTWTCLAREVTPSFQPASGPASRRSSRCTS